MLYLRPQRVYKPSAASQYNSDDYLAHILDQMDESLYRLRLETPRGTSITEDNSQITCYAHIFNKRDGTELTDLLKGRGWRPTWLLDDKPIDSARISEEGYLLTLETTHLPAIYQTVTLQARDTDILLALTDETQDKAWLQRVIASGDFPSHLLQASEKLLDIHYLDKLRINGIEIVKQELSKEIAANATALEELNKHPLTVSQDGYWRIWDAIKKTYVTTEYQSRGEKGEQGEAGATGEKGPKGDTPKLTLDDQYRLLADGVQVSMESLRGPKGDRGERGYRGYQGEAGATGEKGPKGDTPKLTLDDQYHLLADGVQVSMKSLKGPKGDKPSINWEGTKLIVDNMAPVDLRGQRGETGARGATGQTGPRGEAGHSPSPEEVLRAQGFEEMLDKAVWYEVKPVKDDLSTANTNIASLQEVALTTEMREDLDYLTNSLQVLRSGNNNSLEGLTLQRYIALSRNGKDVSAYLASNALDAVLKAGIVDFGKPTEREQVEITHQGTGHFGNLYFNGNQIDFRTSRDDDPYLSVGAEESQFIDDFLRTARIDNTPVAVGSVTLTTSTTSYECPVDVANDGTRLTVSIGDLMVATFQGATTRLTFDGEVLAEWRGARKIVRGLDNVEVYEEPYTASNLSYERVVKAGRHAIRLEIANPTDGARATVRGLRVRRRYDTGAQQSVLTKSGLRLFGAPDRYLDVDYRRQYYNSTPGNGVMIGWLNNPYTVRIKGGAKVDRLEVDKIEGAGAKLSPIVTPQLGLGGQTTLYPKYDEWVLTSDARAQYISFSGLNAEIGKSIYIQTRRKAYLYANGHSFFGLPGDASKGTAVDQWLSNNTTYRFVRASATSWLVTASSSPYPWT